MAQKSDARKQRDARVEQLRNAPPEQQRASFVLNSESIPESLYSFIKEAASAGAIVTLFPFVGTYSPTLSPLEYGKAVQITANQHGQIHVRFVINFDRKTEVEVSEEDTILAEFSELRDLWKDAYNESWQGLVESD